MNSDIFNMNQDLLNTSLDFLVTSPFLDQDHEDSIAYFSNPFGFENIGPYQIKEQMLEQFNSCEIGCSPCPSPSNSEENSANKQTSCKSNDKTGKNPKCLEIQINNSEKNEGKNEIKENGSIIKPTTEIKKEQIYLDSLKNEESLSLPNSKIEENNFYHLEAIKKKFWSILEKIDDLLQGGKNTTRIEENYMAKSKRSPEENENENPQYLSKKRKIIDLDDTRINKKEGKGRTKLGSKMECEHTKLKEDKLMFKIKSNINNWILNLINSFLEEDQKLLKMNFSQFSKNINSKDNLKFLEMKLWEIFSNLEISSIYSKVSREKGLNVNKKKIEEIMKGDNEIVKKMLKITYEEWLDIYRFKEIKSELIEEIGEDKLNGRVIDFLKKAYTCEIKDLKKKEKDEREAVDFVSSLLVMIYNFKLWFSMKRPRIKRTQKNQNDMNENLTNMNKKQVNLEDQK